MQFMERAGWKHQPGWKEKGAYAEMLADQLGTQQEAKGNHLLGVWCLGIDMLRWPDSEGLEIPLDKVTQEDGRKHCGFSFIMSDSYIVLAPLENGKKNQIQAEFL